MIAGIDGCPNAWFALIQDDEGELESRVVRDLGDLLAQGTWRAVAIDIPIGLTDSGPRRCDLEARKLLGKRGSSVFPAPIRPAIQAKDRQTAHAISMAVQNKGVGAQAFGIYAKVREVDELLQSHPEWRESVFEVHPELSFSAWQGGSPMSQPKRSRQGFNERLALVESTFGESAFENVRQKHSHGKVADDDILDAFAALWTARRIIAGSAIACPSELQNCPMGYPITIWY